MKKVAILALMISLALTAGLSGASQEAKPLLRHEIIKLNYVRSVDTIVLLQPYLSREGRINNSPNQNIISLSDHPENVDSVLAAVKEIDVKPADVLFTIQLVLASEDGAEKTDEALAGDPIIKELKSFLKYRSFNLLDTSIVRGIDGRRSEITLGRRGEFILDFIPKVIEKEKTDFVQVEVSLRQIGELYTQKQTSQKDNETITTEQTQRRSQILIDSNLTVISGEKTVVGVSRTAGGEKGLILIISAKIV